MIELDDELLSRCGRMSKAVRMIGRGAEAQAKFEQGLVHFPKQAEFLATLEAELLALPHGKTDDQVDSISQALSYKQPSYNLDGFKGLPKLLQAIAHQTY